MKTWLSVAPILIAFSTNSAAMRQEPIKPIPPLENVDTAKVELGKKLFFDPRLSKSGFISCNSCHNLATGGVDNLPSSIGHKWQLGPINAPTVLNAKFHIAQFWDGRAKDLQEQAGGPIANPGEMGSTHTVALEVIRSIPAYRESFQKAYKSPEVTLDRLTDAIAKFEETLITPGAPFDKWLAGDDTALTAQEKRGYDLFKTKGCVSCHNGVAVGGNTYQKVGIVKPFPGDRTNLGRYNVTKKEGDKHVFKVPSLRNIELTYPYFHDGSVWTLEEAVKIMADIQLGLPVNQKETADIVAFLKSLTGEQPQVTVPILPPSVATTPRPVTY